MREAKHWRIHFLISGIKRRWPDIHLSEGAEWCGPRATHSCWWIIKIAAVLILPLIRHRWSFSPIFKYSGCAVRLRGPWMFYERGCSSVRNWNRTIFSLHGPLSHCFLNMSSLRGATPHRPVQSVDQISYSVKPCICNSNIFGGKSSFSVTRHLTFGCVLFCVTFIL